MRLKLDENFDVQLVPVLRNAGFDVETVRDEGLSGAADEAIYQVCRDSRRALVTPDLDFANPFRYPPEPTAGIVVVRVPRPLLSLIRVTLLDAVPALKSGASHATLWIVEPGRIRVHEPRRGSLEEEPE